MKRCGVEDLEKALQNKTECRVIDVREAPEFEAEHIEGSCNVPLSGFNAQTKDMLDPNKRLYLVCQSGVRAAKAAKQLSAWGCAECSVVEGGLKAWTVAKKPVLKGASGVWSLDRQVRLAAGSLVLTGLIWAWWIHPAFLILSAFVAGGLIFSAVTDTCGLAMLLAKMPWNKSKPGCSS